MSSASGAEPPPEIQWVKVAGADALRPLDRHWIRYLRIVLLAAAVLVAWRILASQEDGYRAAAESATAAAVVAAASSGVTTGQTTPLAGGPSDGRVAPAPTGPAIPVVVIPPTPTPTATPVATPTPKPTPTPLAHRVLPGDTLSGIAEFYDVAIDELLALNEIANPNSLVAGQRLLLPPDARLPASQPKPPTYTVQPGDTLSAIAVRFGVSIIDLLDVNNLDDPNSIFVGQSLRIPGGGA